MFPRSLATAVTKSTGPGPCPDCTPLSTATAVAAIASQILNMPTSLGSTVCGMTSAFGQAVEYVTRSRTRDLRYVMLNGRLYDAQTLAPVDGRGGEAPRFFWQGMQESPSPDYGRRLRGLPLKPCRASPSRPVEGTRSSSTDLYDY
jgi:hypothetical protein